MKLFTVGLAGCLVAVAATATLADVVVFENDKAGWDAAVGAAPVLLTFEDVGPLEEGAWQVISGDRYQAYPCHPALTPDPESQLVVGKPGPGFYAGSFPPQSGDNVFVLDPPGGWASKGILTVTFSEPVSAFGAWFLDVEDGFYSTGLEVDGVLHAFNDSQGNASASFMGLVSTSPINEVKVHLNSAELIDDGIGIDDLMYNFPELLGHPLDLSGWNLDAPLGSWTYSNPAAYTGRLDEGGGPAWVVSDFALPAMAHFRITLRVEGPTNDDDFIGVAFGYQDATHFYLLDWKKAEQTHDFGDPVTVNDDVAEAGIKLKKVDGSWTRDGLWGGTDGDGVFSLAGPVGTEWQVGVPYTFDVHLTAGHILIEQEGAQLFDVYDDAYSSGAIALYGFSQDNLVFANVTNLLWEDNPNPEDDTTEGDQSDVSGTSSDPVNTGTGSFFHQETDLSIPSRGSPLTFTRFYNSKAAAPGRKTAKSGSAPPKRKTPTSQPASTQDGEQARIDAEKHDKSVAVKDQKQTAGASQARPKAEEEDK